MSLHSTDQPPAEPVQRARKRLQRQVRAEQVRQACKQHGPGRAAAASLGISRHYLSRLRRELGLIDQDETERDERVRQALAHPVREAALMLGCKPQHVYRLRRKYAAQAQQEAQA